MESAAALTTGPVQHSISSGVTMGHKTNKRMDETTAESVARGWDGNGGQNQTRNYGIFTRWFKTESFGL